MTLVTKSPNQDVLRGGILSRVVSNLPSGVVIQQADGSKSF